MPDCACGCGEWGFGDYRRGHHPRSAETRKLLSEAALRNPNPGNYERTEEHKQRMREAIGDRSGERNSFYGKIHTEETRKLLSERLISEETKEKIRRSALGRIPSDETRQKMSEAHRGYEASEETRQKISEALLGRVLSEEWRQRDSESHKALWQDPEYAERMTKAFHRRPTAPEQRIIDLIEEYQLPFAYNGNRGTFSISGKVPDFVATDGSMRLIEVLGNYWHRNFLREEERKRVYRQEGYACLFLYTSVLEYAVGDEILEWLEQLKQGTHIEPE